MAHLSKRHILVAVRWAARAVAAALLALIAAFAIGEGVPNPLHMSLTENLLSAALLSMVAGLILAWKWEGVGAGLILGGFASFALVNHGVRLNIVFGPLLATGLLFLLCWWRGRIKDISLAVRPGFSGPTRPGSDLP